MMRRRGGGSSALDRAESLLSARSSRTRGRGQGFFKTTSNPPNKQVSFCNLSDLSADSSAAGENSEQDSRPHSGFGGGSRFLKKAPPPTSSSRSPVDRKQNLLEPRSVPASQQESQTQISAESRSSDRAPETTDCETNGPSHGAGAPTEVSISAASATQQHSAQWSSGGSRFLKKKMGAGSTPAAALRSGGGVRSTPLQDLESKPGKAESVDSDEEYMKKLLGESVDCSDSSLAEEGGRPPLKEPQKMLSSQRTHSIPSPPSSAPHRHSPFRYSGRSQNHFSPSVSSPATPLPGKTSDFPKAESPQQLSSSSSECVEVLSLEELLPGGSVSSEAQSKRSEVSEDLHVSIKNLDELIPASTSEAESQDESRQSDPTWWRTHQQLSQEDEEVVDYHSDFHSYSSGTQVSEELSDEEGTPSEIRTDGADSVVSSHTPPEPRRHASQTSLASVRVSSKQRSSSSRKHLKNAAAQTQPDHLIHADDASVPSAVARIYLSAAPGRGYALTAEQLEDIGTYNPAVFVVNEVLKQQLAMIKESVDSSRHLHSSLMQSLEPPSYRYTTLQDTIQNIRRRRPSKLAMERHLEEVLQKVKLYHKTPELNIHPSFSLSRAWGHRSHLMSSIWLYYLSTPINLQVTLCKRKRRA
ncbi:uncharacterized protein C19orf44 homolog isoform X3 [Oryzias latipes]|uniref:uncharacterized protein C19orf44 homolog isoform X3 n=1 Tax=Oryzias latipes TaxID=8090 RepID=UPI000CE21227|nr:uncharacterized protein C19orf44 homolog isoform X3 [Oryzias latipes]